MSAYIGTVRRMTDSALHEKTSMDIAGARWGLEGTEAILKLRALTVSGDFHRTTGAIISAASTNASITQIP